MNRTTLLKITSLLVGLLTLSSPSSLLWAGSQKSAAGLTLLESPSARATALGEAFTAASNDATAQAYNPASLMSLKTGQAAFLYQKGISDDSYGQLTLGLPRTSSSWGLSIGMYDGGSTMLSQNGIDSKSATVQKDLKLSLSYAHPLKEGSWGLTGTYFSSDLAEQAKATAFAANMGLQFPLNSKLRMGAAFNNLGTSLKYDKEAEDLPSTARVGFSFSALKRTTLYIDGIYSLPLKEINPAAGVELWAGPLALRAGYKAGSDLEGFTLGTGVNLSRFSLDYSFGFVDSLDARQKISVAMSFGGGTANPVLTRSAGSEEEVSMKVSPYVEQKESSDMKKATRPAVTFVAPPGPKEPDPKETRTIYEVKTNDSLAKIAKSHYGDIQEWKKIYQANKEVLGDANTLVVGMKIVLP